MRLKTLSSLSAVLILVAAVPARAQDTYRLLLIDEHPVKWGAPERGTGATITYHLAGEASKGGNVNCRGITPLAPLLSYSHIGHRTFGEALDAAVRAWESAADVRFVRVGDDQPANLTISAEQIPDGVAFTDVTTASSATSITPLESAIICLNPRVRWSAAPHDKHAKALTYVLEHEIGHALGLDHPGPEGELMSFEYSDTIRTLQPGDIEGIVSLYGRAAHAVALASPVH